MKRANNGVSNGEDKLIVPITQKKGGKPYTGPHIGKSLLTLLDNLPREAMLERSRIHGGYAQLNLDWICHPSFISPPPGLVVPED
jgi:hypothetical protein